MDKLCDLLDIRPGVTALIGGALLGGRGKKDETEN